MLVESWVAEVLDKCLQNSLGELPVTVPQTGLEPPGGARGPPLSANTEERSEMLAVLCLWRGPGVVEQGKLTAFHCKTYREKTAYV